MRGTIARSYLDRPSREKAKRVARGIVDAIHFEADAKRQLEASEMRPPFDYSTIVPTDIEIPAVSPKREEARGVAYEQAVVSYLRAGLRNPQARKDAELVECDIKEKLASVGLRGAIEEALKPKHIAEHLAGVMRKNYDLREDLHQAHGVGTSSVSEAYHNLAPLPEKKEDVRDREISRHLRRILNSSHRKYDPARSLEENAHIAQKEFREEGQESRISAIIEQALKRREKRTAEPSSDWAHGFSLITHMGGGKGGLS